MWDGLTVDELIEKLTEIKKDNDNVGSYKIIIDVDGRVTNLDVVFVKEASHKTVVLY